MDKRLILSLIFIVSIFMLVVSVSASNPVQEAKIGQLTNITQPCSVNNATGGFCDSCHLKAIDNPPTLGGYFLPYGGYAMNNLGNGSFIYNVTFATAGDYIAHGFCSAGSLSSTFDFTIHVTTTGSNQNLIIPILLGLLGIIFLVVGIFQRNPYLGLFSGFLFLILGIYSMIYGFGVVQDKYTEMVSYILLGVGLMVCFASVAEMYYEGDDED